MLWTKIAQRSVCVAAAGCLLGGMGALSVSAAPRVGADARTASDPSAARSHLPLQFYTLDGTTRVVSSRHDHLVLTLRAENSRNGATPEARPRTTVNPSVDLSINLANRGNTQSNLWDFPLPGRTLTANPTKGAGRLATKSKLKPYGAIHLVIKPVGKLHTQSLCPQERQTRRAVQLHGHFLFNTGPAVAHSQGKVGSRKHAFSLHATLTAHYSKPNDNPNCFSQPHQPCPAAVTAEYFGPTEPDGSEMSFIASPQGNSTSLEGSQDTPLDKPHGAQRVDEVVTRADDLVITPLEPGASVTITAKGPHAAGSATLSTSSDPTSNVPDYCRHPSTQTFYDAIVATNSPFTPTLRFDSQLAGKFSVPDDATAGVFFTYQRD